MTRVTPGIFLRICFINCHFNCKFDSPLAHNPAPLQPIRYEQLAGVLWESGLTSVSALQLQLPTFTPTSVLAPLNLNLHWVRFNLTSLTYIYLSALPLLLHLDLFRIMIFIDLYTVQREIPLQNHSAKLKKQKRKPYLHSPTTPQPPCLPPKT